LAEHGRQNIKWSLTLNIAFSVLFLIVVYFDTYFFARSTFVFEAIFRLPHLVNLVLVIQFCNLVYYIRQKLIELGNILVYYTEGCSVLKTKMRPLSYGELEEITTTGIPTSVIEVITFNDVSEIPRNGVIQLPYKRSQKSQCTFNEMIALKRVHNCVHKATQLVNSLYGLPILLHIIHITSSLVDRLCGRVIRVSGYRSRGPGFDSRRFHIF
jgi:hypothetical protein